MVDTIEEVIAAIEKAITEEVAEELSEEVIEEVAEEVAEEVIEDIPTFIYDGSTEFIVEYGTTNLVLPQLWKLMKIFQQTLLQVTVSYMMMLQQVILKIFL
ncbi:hypothetical protein AN639_12315 [Candidatus Epulonipiscium fishelsonii]|nr:hypothetical protein AN639_12315 [Epulopiscium sp. SCG-B05WGA-EpuloA1]